MEFKKKELADLRENYGIATLLESDVDKNPFIQFQKWIETAIKEKIVDPNAMTLATVGAKTQRHTCNPCTAEAKNCSQSCH